MTYREAMDYVKAAGSLGSKPGLSRISELCEKLGDPQDKIPAVHVAGTNGKGSVCAMLSCALRAAGLKTGLFSSPHLRFFEERITVNGVPIPEDRFAAVTEKIRAAAEKMSDPATEFEISTAAAFLYFAEEKCDIAVIEAGMGGRLDSTNVIKSPLLSVITGIALEHTAYLGDTLQKIAAEKAGIIKEGRPVVVGDCPAEALGVIKEKAAALGCELIKADTNGITNKRFSLSGTGVYEKELGEVTLRLAGVYQPANAAVAIAAARSLKKSGVPLTDKDVINGLANTVWPGRFEVLSEDPVTVYDGAHNPQGVSALAENIRTLLGGRVIFVMGVMADKKYADMVKTLSPFAAAAFTVAPDNPRALDAAALAEEFIKNGVSAEACESVPAGVFAAADAAVKKKLPLLICGSLYMYSAAADAVKKYRER